ncbi:hypothetical protein Dimus_002609 [Dionaea muscipula]
MDPFERLTFEIQLNQAMLRRTLGCRSSSPSCSSSSSKAANHVPAVVAAPTTLRRRGSRSCFKEAAHEAHSIYISNFRSAAARKTRAGAADHDHDHNRKQKQQQEEHQANIYELPDDHEPALQFQFASMRRRRLSKSVRIM